MYIEIVCRLQDNDNLAEHAEIVIALLAEAGCESFEESGNEVKAYIREDKFDAAAFPDLAKEYPAFVASTDIRHVKQENWNLLWESNFPMTTIAERCVVYAPFHTDVPNLEYRINILPQMSFGTGHHETTSLMVTLMLDMDVKDKRVLDMGCGTGILAIFAAMKGAKPVMAIDIDEWAYKNAAENCARNDITGIDIMQGDCTLLAGKCFDLILANINRNILLSDISTYAQCLPDGGLLQLSGFYTADLPDITTEAGKNGLVYIRHLVKKDWVAVQFSKSA